MPLDYFLKNKIKLYKTPFNLSDDTIDNWTMWKFQRNIELINEELKPKTTNSLLDVKK
jgi:ribosomal protein S10